ncbi:hypothetical protein BX661DRAFT_205999 [Kickxella alabastrina]|uniref:uncharacterized protein n=1 Tax=Kickxella alabastrina TaxID=61397 RepID=UPI00221F0855|nr:uncharacterized protein BX661DRAFT_205999 [Kickxella alabastrina]KAI7826411.1 hypothetical protein BX661DRAFT_205999 [Kickxella alabastrina]
MFSLCRLAAARLGTNAAVTAPRQLHTGSAALAEMKRRALPTTTSIKYTIPTDPYLLAQKFRNVLQQGKLDDAVAIVMQSKKRDQSGVVWNLVIDAYAQDGRLSRALRAFTEMRRRGFPPTPTTYTALFKACSLSNSENSMDMADELFDSMSKYGVKPTIISINALLAVYQRKHNVEAILERFNSLSADGPDAPTLATYTIVLSALRRELQIRLAEITQKSKDGNAVVHNARRMALLKEHVHQTFGALMNTWAAFAEDAAHRLDEPMDGTPPLHIDTRAINTVLKACHAVYKENRALGRQGLRVIELAYGLTKALPLALRIRRAAPGSGGDAGSSGAVVDSTTIDLALELCIRDRQFTKAVRFWSSLETNFGPLIKPSKANHALYLECLSARLRQNETA